ncbi:MAG: 6,7-dimethyl-8-ribityllumazine synthase [Nanoarchaeota archaeon]|nr:6,7-dimethyl-8-ribityllumazine synthase [Nanoarchaeota archaeon]
MTKEKIGIVVSDTYADITDAMLTVGKKHAEFLGVDVVKVMHVPGSFDMPIAIKHMLKKQDIDGIVTLGAVIEGDTDHDTIVAQNAARKITDLSVEYEKPVSLGISGPKMNRMEAMEHIDKMAKAAVESCVKMIRRLK